MILRRQAGDTLVEVVVALAILTLVLVSAYTISSLSTRLGIQARERTEAIHLAQQQAERLTAYRDQLIQDNQTPPPPDGSGVYIFTATNFPKAGLGALGPAYILRADLSTDTTCAATGCVNGRYNVAVNSRIDTKYRTEDLLTSTINVTWTSAIGNAQNTLSFNLILGDKRANAVRDCSVKGDPLCLH